MRVEQSKMKGHVQTPASVAERMVDLSFEDRPPEPGDRILYPGCGSDGPFISAVATYCEANDLAIPEGVAFETHPDRFSEVTRKHDSKPIEFRNSDFLEVSAHNLDSFEYVIGNPPYVQIEEIEKKSEYKQEYRTATDRFDLYILFFEQGLRLLANGGRLCFITPEKFEYTQTTTELRRMLRERHIERIEHLPETTFSGYVTYPAITVVSETDPGPTRIIRRNGTSTSIELPEDGESWAPHIRESSDLPEETGVTLQDVATRISCGVATGRDKIFVQDADKIPPQLIDHGWTCPTISGKQLELYDGPPGPDRFICPYDDAGNLLPEQDLGVYLEWATMHRSELESRSCVKNGKPWYSWHETPPMDAAMGTEKLLWKDVARTPHFWIDAEGATLPRHSVYYLVPADGVDIKKLQAYLNSPPVHSWLEANCQRASNGYIRLQSTVLKELPVPPEIGSPVQTTLT